MIHHSLSLAPMTKIDKSAFLFHDLVGEGGFGKVYAACLISTHHWLAIKEIDKYNLLTVREMALIVSVIFSYTFICPLSA